MYISLRQKKRFLKFFIFFLVLAIVVFFVNRDFFVNYSEMKKPQNLVLSNVTENSVTISWITQMKTGGYIVVYDGNEQIGKFDSIQGSGKKHIHYVDVNGLRPSKLYEFEIFSDKEKNLNENGEKFTFLTRNISEEIPMSNIVQGNLEFENVLVFLIVDDLSLNYPLSTYVMKRGSWSLDLSKISLANGGEDFEFREDTPVKLLFFNENGSKVIWGNRNVLFDSDGNFVEENLKLDGLENIFLHIPDFAKFKDIDLVEDRVVEEKEEIEVKIEKPEEKEEVLGTEVEELVQDGFQWEATTDSNKLTDYGFR